MIERVSAARALASIDDELFSLILPAGEDLVALSFDDGWADNWLYATPVLKERKLRAVLAMSAGYLHDGEVRQSEAPEILALSMAEAAIMSVLMKSNSS